MIPSLLLNLAQNAWAQGLNSTLQPPECLTHTPYDNGFEMQICMFTALEETP